MLMKQSFLQENRKQIIEVSHLSILPFLDTSTSLGLFHAFKEDIPKPDRINHVVRFDQEYVLAQSFVSDLTHSQWLLFRFAENPDDYNSNEKYIKFNQTWGKEDPISSMLQESRISNLNLLVATFGEENLFFLYSGWIRMLQTDCVSMSLDPPSLISGLLQGGLPMFDHKENTQDWFETCLLQKSSVFVSLRDTV